MIRTDPVEVIETDMFSKAVRNGGIAESSVEDAIDQVAWNPEAGAVVQGTGGARKIRVAAPGRGKRGSFRVVYYFVSDDGQVYLITMYAKVDKSDLTPDEKRAIHAVVNGLKS